MAEEYLLVTLLIIQLVLSSWLMWRSPLNAVSVVGMLTTVFAYLPAVLLIDGPGFESYSWRNFTRLDVAAAVDVAIFLGIMNLCLLLGAVAAEQFTDKNQFINAAPDAARQQVVHLHDSPQLGFLSAVYFTLWAGVAILLFQQSGQTVSEFLLPVKKTGIAAEQSGYLRSMYMAIPSALVVMSYWKHGRLRLLGWIWVGLALISTFSTHQRRELITTALLLLSLGLFLRPLRESHKAGAAKHASDSIKQARRVRVLILGVLSLGLLLVPLLWYARVYFTSLSSGSGVNAFEVRSFQDVLFGSPSTGFPVLVYVEQYVSDAGTNPFYLFVYPLTIFIPRALWQSKPIDLDTRLESYYWLIENPSSFWFGEMFYAFGYVAPFFTLVLSFALYRFCLKCQYIPNLWYRTLGALFFMQCVTLFKNGVTVFIIESSVLIVLLGFAWVSARQHGEGIPKGNASAGPKRGVPV